MGTKMAVAFANIFTAKVETDISNQSALEPLVWKWLIDDIFSLWTATIEEITQFTEQANKHNQTIKFTADVSETETKFLDTAVYKGERFTPTETFQYTHFSTCHPSGVKRGFIKGEALRLLRTKSSKTLFEKSVTNFKTHLLERGYPENFIQTTLSEVTFEDRYQALRQKQKQKKKILPFVTQYHPAVFNLKPILMNSWHFITQQPLLNDRNRP